MVVQDIYKLTVKVSCGSEKGTAFFIDNNRLLTARHIIAPYFVSEEMILIQIGNENYHCTAEEVKEGIDVVVLICIGYKTLGFLKVVNMPIKRKQKYKFFGYSNNLIGQSSGIHIEVIVHDYHESTDNDFDTTATIIGQYQPSIFKGFSGSPVYGIDNVVIGVVSMKLDGCIGFISIKSISKELQDFGVELIEEWDRYDEDYYGKRENRAILKTIIDKAGPRYERDLHQKNERLEIVFEDLWNLKLRQSKIDRLNKFELDFQNLLNTESITIPNEIKNVNLLDSKKNIIVYKSFFYGDKKKQLNKINNIEKFIEEFKIVEDIFYEVIEEPYRILCIKGKAGTGKTHLMCNISEQLIDKTNVYLYFGNQFNTIQSPEIQLQQIYNFPNKNFLEDLNDKAFSESKRYLFILDALNEGAGDGFWAVNIRNLIEHFQKLESLALVFTIRSPFEDRILREVDNILFHNLTGFTDIKSAKKAYFEVYKIDYSIVQSSVYEFENCLFLKIFCETYSKLPYYHRDQLNTYSLLFKHYIKRKEFDIADIIDEDPKKQIALKFLHQIARKSVNSFHCDDVNRSQARTIADRLCRNRPWSKNLLNATIQESLLLENIDYEDNDAIMFAYERLGDFLKAITTIESKRQHKQLVQFLEEMINNSVYSKSKVLNYIVALNVVWDEKHGTELIEELKLEDKPEFVMCFIESIPLRSSFTKKTYLNTIILKYLSNDFKFLFNFFTPEKLESKILDYDNIHGILYKMSLYERDLKWTSIINKMYQEDELEQYYSITFVQEIMNKNDTIQLDYCIVLCWLLTSSHPVVRDRITRVLFHILERNSSIIIDLISKFDNVNDLYILDKLYCAIYGVVLVTEDKNTISEIAIKVYNSIFKEKTPPCHLHLRSWALKILERAKHLKVEEQLFEKSLPPYNSEIELPKELDYKALLGKSDGSESIYNSVFGFEDFARYIIGTNSNIESKSFTKHLINEDVDSANKFFLLEDIQKMLLSEIKNLGWNDDLAKLDKGVYSYNRHENETERIGKKYQWLALYSVVAKLLDKYKLCDSWYQSKVYDINYPWLTNYHSYFDPTIKIPELSKELESDFFHEFKLPEIDALDGIEWIESNLDLIKPFHFRQLDASNKKWILLTTFQSLPKEIKDQKLDYFLRYDSYFIDNDDLKDFEKWAKEQNFYGRWMPEHHDQYEYFLNEYPWSESYKCLKITNIDRPGNDCPCELIVTTESQLQENWNGTNKDYSSTTLLPNHQIMNEFELKIKKERGLFYNKLDEVVAVYNYPNKKGKKGLYMRQDLLDEYMKINNLTMVYSILGEKSLRSKSMTYGIYKDMSGSYKYSNGQIETISELKIFEK